MSEYIITASSTADITKQEFEELKVPYISFSYFVDGKEHKDDLFEKTSAKEFFDSIAAGAMPTTSQIAPEEYVEFWRPFLEEGKDVLHVTLSSGISGTYQSACIAKGVLSDEFPDRTVEVVDSLCASSGYGLLITDLKQKVNEGFSLAEAKEWVENNKLSLHHLFFSTDLTSFIRGGRVSKVSGFVGSMLNICPIMFIDSDGKITVKEKARGKKMAIKRIMELIAENIKDDEDYNGKVYICNSDCMDDAKAVANLIEKKYKSMEGKVKIFNIGPVIGAHTGPGTVAVFFWGNERKL